jgi:hypothetical protein
MRVNDVNGNDDVIVPACKKRWEKQKLVCPWHLRNNCFWGDNALMLMPPLISATLECVDGFIGHVTPYVRH